MVALPGKPTLKLLQIQLQIPAKYIQKNVDTLTITSATFGFGNFPDNFVCN